MIQYRQGNIFLTTCEWITVTVNCEGVMGAGIALDARMRWPAMFEAYVEACESEDVRIGRVWTWEGPGFPLPGDDVEVQRVLCFPTKDRWRAPSRVEYLEAGLADLTARHETLGIRSLAMPRLGTSHGRLEWANVEPLVQRTLRPLPNLQVEVWERVSDGDPWLDAVRAIIESESGDVQRVKERFNFSRTTQAAKLIQAVRSPGVRDLIGLSDFVGEVTLQSVYDTLRQRGPVQESMF